MTTPYVELPALKNHFALAGISGVSRAAVNTLRNSLIAIDLSIKPDDSPIGNSRLFNKGMITTLTLIIEDDLKGTITNAISALTASSQEINIDMLSGSAGDVVSSFNLYDCTAISIDYDLNYALSETAKYIVKYAVKNFNRTVSKI